MNTNFLQIKILYSNHSFTNQERISPVKRIITFAAALALSLVAVSSSMAQTYKPDWATKLVLAGGGTDVTNTVTLTTAPGGAAPITLTFPNAYAGGAGYVLTSTTTGGLSWTDPATAITLDGDVTGAAGNNSIAATLATGNHIVAALNLATASTLNADVLKYGTTLTVASNALDIDLSHANTWTGVQSLPASAAQASNLVSAVNASTSPTSLNADVLKYDASLKVASNQLGIDLAHANTWTGTQTINGAGKLIYTDGNEAAGKILTSDANGVASWSNVAASSLTLADGKVFIGNGSNVAAEQTLGGDISLFNNTGTVHVNSVQTGAGSTIATAINSNAANAINGENVKHDATFAVDGSHNLQLNVANQNTWTGTQTFGGLKVSSNAATQLTANQDDWGLSASNSYFFISSDATRNVTGIANGADGRMIVLVNSGSNAIVLKNGPTASDDANEFSFPGGASGDLIMAPGATVTLIYDATDHGAGAFNKWRLVSAQ
jgi:hypothetical protein